MSKIALSGNPLGSGTFTIASPNSNNDRTVNLLDSAGDLVVTSATQTLSNKTFSGAQTFGTASLAQPTGTAPLYMCRAWVNFNGTGTVAIRAAGNVSSIADNGTGDYTVNFTTAMPDANYAVVANSQIDTSGSVSVPTHWEKIARTAGALATSSVRLWAGNASSFSDPLQMHVAIFR